MSPATIPTEGKPGQLRQPSAAGGVRRFVQRILTWQRLVREAKEPRWQGRLVRPVVSLVAERRRVEFESLTRAELLARRLLGQPLSRRAWQRMTFNDKVTYRRLCVRDPIFQCFSDKLSMRDFITARLGANSVPALLEVAEQAATLASLDGPFVLKPNHASGLVMPVGERGKLTGEQISRADGWLRFDCAWLDLEWGYLAARKLLLVEEYVHEPGRLRLPFDYKLFAFDGQVLMIDVITGRLRGVHSILRYPDWSPVPGFRPEYPRAAETETPRPANLELMLDWASTLSRGIGFVRVDLYDLGDRVKVGELTPYPCGGNSPFSPPTLDAWLGRAWSRKPWIRGGVQVETELSAETPFPSQG